MSLQASFTLMPVAVSLGPDGSDDSTDQTLDPRPPTTNRVAAAANTATGPSHYLLIPGTDVHTRDSRQTLCGQISQDSALTHGNKRREQGLEPFRRSLPIMPARASSLDWNDYGDDDSTIATEDSHVRAPPPPLSVVQFPAVDGCVVELSKDDWRDMYVHSRRAKRKLQSFTASVLHENRALKRQLIQMQKLVNENRRNHFLSTTATQALPWSIPEQPAPLRRRLLSEPEEGV